MFMPSIFGENLFDSFFEDFDHPVKSLARMSAPTTGIMKTDVKEKDDAFEIDIDLPGCKKEDVKAELNDGYMTITAVSQGNTEEKGLKFLRRERYFGTSSRSFYVGEAVTQEDIKAKFENGVLRISVPKKELIPEPQQQKYIAIE